jgi:cytochrome c oxidase subunit 2
LLRTKRMLALPAHVNITVLTNSYDVVHSWFLPDQGIKFDCVPGRSTHHTYYISSPGDSRGQCAEVCGRFHHHMPIYLIGLLREEFYVWWLKHSWKFKHIDFLWPPIKSTIKF